MAAARARTSVMVNLAMVVEQANEQVLPAVYLFVGKSLNATPVQLGTLTLCRAMVQTLASPLSGILGDRYDRVAVLATGAILWSIMTSAMAHSATLHQAMAFAALNGLGLALLVPCCQSLTADLYPAEQRGRAFGMLQLTASLGGMLGGVFATNVGGLRPWGMDGWRAAFHAIAVVSLLVGGLTLLLAVDPRRFRFTLLPTSDVTSCLLTDTPSPANSACSAGGQHDDCPQQQQRSTPSAASSGAQLGGAGGSLSDRRRSAQPHAAGGGLVLHTSNSTSRGPSLLGGSSSSSALGKGPGVARRASHSSSSSCHLLDDTAPAPDDDTGRRHAGEQLLLPSVGLIRDTRAAYQQQQQLHTTLLQQRTSGQGLHQHHFHAAPDSLPAHHHQQHHPHHHQPHAGSAAGTSSNSSTPRKQPAGGGGCDAAGDDDSSSKARFRRRGVVADVCWMLRIRTFQAIVLQGIVGCFPWQAMVFFTLWLQLCGFSNATASLLVATFGGGVALGALLGGAVGDRMARRLPNSGRILTAQFSVFCGVPLTWLLLKGLPASPWAASPGAFGACMFVMGLTCTWAGAGCNSPIFAEIVPDELRSTIYAFDRSFENSIAACAAPVVGLLAERAFGFQGVLSDDALSDQVLRARNAAALGSSLLACMTVPWSLCLLFYGALHWTYPKDRVKAKAWAGAAGGGGMYHH